MRRAAPSRTRSSGRGLGQPGFPTFLQPGEEVSRQAPNGPTHDRGCCSHWLCGAAACRRVWYHAAELSDKESYLLTTQGAITACNLGQV